MSRAEHLAEGVVLYNADCRDMLPTLAPFDACVTDPPYGLSFMGKSWDYDVPSAALWAEVLQSLKPGGHLLAFAGTRTQHRMACAIEDAGFELRDMIAWVYGSGFPKSLDVSKALDKAAGADREAGPIDTKRAARLVNQRGDYTTDAGWSVGNRTVTIDPPATDAARQWQGWGTALKPALEPITIARKPLIGTVAENVLAHGTGALNIDGCRVATNGERPTGSGNGSEGRARTNEGGVLQGNGGNVTPDTGRWPANLIHDGSEEVVAGFPANVKGAVSNGRKGAAGIYDDGIGSAEQRPGYADTGSAARFFYCAKASKADRGDNAHPTVKPTDLMAYLCRLVTPPGGSVLDPFMGSGSTGKAAIREGFRFIGIERDPVYFDIACRRLSEMLKHPKQEVFAL